MAQRSETGSKIPLVVIDLTQDSPRRPLAARHRATALQVLDLDAAPQQRGNQEVIVPKEIVQVPKDVKKMSEDKDKDKASSLPYINTSMTGTPEILTCAICFESMSANREPMATRCGHVFCKECLTTSLKHRKRCPTCQFGIHISKCVRLYFS